MRELREELNTLINGIINETITSKEIVREAFNIIGKKYGDCISGMEYVRIVSKKTDKERESIYRLAN